jgi:hypothetical protein
VRGWRSRPKSAFRSLPIAPPSTAAAAVMGGRPAKASDSSTKESGPNGSEGDAQPSASGCCLANLQPVVS